MNTSIHFSCIQRPTPGNMVSVSKRFHIMTTAGQAIWILPGTHGGTGLAVRQSTVPLCPAVSLDL